MKLGVNLPLKGVAFAVIATFPFGYLKAFCNADNDDKINPWLFGSAFSVIFSGLYALGVTALRCCKREEALENDPDQVTLPADTMSTMLGAGLATGGAHVLSKHLNIPAPYLISAHALFCLGSYAMGKSSCKILNIPEETIETQPSPEVEPVRPR